MDTGKRLWESLGVKQKKKFQVLDKSRYSFIENTPNYYQKERTSAKDVLNIKLQKENNKKLKAEACSCTS